MASPAVCFFFYIACSLLLAVPLESALSFNFSDISHAANKGSVRLYGDAFIDGTDIEITKDHHSAGRAVCTDRVALRDAYTGKLTNFITHFSFQITAVVPNSTGDGMTFFLAPPDSVAIPKGATDSMLGLFDTRGDLVAVEFDTYSNADYKEPSSNHIGVDVGSIISDVTTELKNFSLVREATAHATISYDGSNQNLTVLLAYDRDDPDQVARGRTWNLNYTIDLAVHLPDEVIVGFSASTGGGIENHRLLSWSFTSTANSKRSGRSGRWRLLLVVLIGIVLFVSGFGLALAYFKSRRWRRLRTKEIHDASVASLDCSLDSVFTGAGRGPQSFRHDMLVAATGNFADERKLGEGGFGSVYKGVLTDMNGMVVAIKKISQGSFQGKREYISEIAIISRLRHRNLVQLIGYCHEMGELLLIYQYMPNGSLNLHLHGPEHFLGWPARHKIAVGLASALLYLHEEWEQYVIHRDIKSSNVMLDAEFNPKLGDFGLARMVDHGRNMQTTSVLAGTRVYMAPEYLRTGKASKESDIYSFGLVLLEIACGKRPDFIEDSDRVNLVQWVWELYKNNSCLTAADPRLKLDFDEHAMERVLVVGLWCAHPDSSLRPSITSAIGVLNFGAPLPHLSPPSILTTDSFHNIFNKLPSLQGDISSSAVVDLTNPLR